MGVLQHCPFTWEIDGDKLKVLKDTTFDSKMFKNGVNALINHLKEEELKLFADIIYSIIEETKAETVEELMANIGKNARIIFDASSNMDDSKKQLLFKVSSVFFREAFKI